MYPDRLKHIINPPSFLFCQGDINFDAAKVVSIVGTRRATIYGKNFVEKLIADLSGYNDVIVVSGLAYGIDIQHIKRVYIMCYPQWVY
jgi:DNA processing protein